MPAQPTYLTGILTDVFPVQTSASFSKRVFWVKEPDIERYPQHWEIEAHGEDLRHLSKLEIGDRLKVEVEIRGRQYSKRHGGEKAIFTSIKCLGIELLGKIDVTEKYVKKGHDKEVDSNPQKELGLPL